MRAVLCSRALKRARRHPRAQSGISLRRILRVYAVSGFKSSCLIMIEGEEQMKRTYSGFRLIAQTGYNFARRSVRPQTIRHERRSRVTRLILLYSKATLISSEGGSMVPHNPVLLHK